MVFRADVSEFRKPKKTAQGYLRADAWPTRTGVFVYTYGDGRVVRELRHADDVFDSESLASLELVPLTDDHPPEPLTAENTKQYAIGSSGEVVKRDGINVRTSILVTDKEAVKRAETREKTQLSCGYTCDVIEESGEYQGQRYDARQKNIRYNHIAIVDAGRAGVSNAIKMDSAYHVFEEAAAVAVKKEATLSKVRIDGVDYDASEQAIQAFAKFEAAAKAATEALKARNDALTEDVAKLRKELSEATDEKRRQDSVRERVALERVAEKAGVEKCDALSDTDLRKAVICKVRPEAKIDGKDAAYVAAMFDICVSDIASQKGATAALAATNAAAASHADSAEVDLRKARADALKVQSDLWKKPLMATKGGK